MTEKITRLYDEFKKNIQTRKERQTDAWKKRMDVYSERIRSTLFDISTSDECRRKLLQRTLGFAEHVEFLEDQKGEIISFSHVSYC